ncbi:MAG: hypothetical protein JOY59_10760, partial [Candidatus Eremiobacteraeota bacterium]|nr:hypothetical protein [Candidatus Eremiobacteraeota bacterium]
IDRGRGYEAGEFRAADVLSEGGRGLWLVSRLGGRLDVNVIDGFGAHTMVTLPTVATTAPSSRAARRA